MNKVHLPGMPKTIMPYLQAFSTELVISPCCNEVFTLGFVQEREHRILSLNLLWSWVPTNHLHTIMMALFSIWTLQVHRALYKLIQVLPWWLCNLDIFWSKSFQICQGIDKIVLRREAMSDNRIIKQRKQPSYLASTRPSWSNTKHNFFLFRILRVLTPICTADLIQTLGKTVTIIGLRAIRISGTIYKINRKKLFTNKVKENKLLSTSSSQEKKMLLLLLMIREMLNIVLVFPVADVCKIVISKCMIVSYRRDQAVQTLL